jgi:hypothetical protein
MFNLTNPKVDCFEYTGKNKNGLHASFLLECVKNDWVLESYHNIESARSYLKIRICHTIFIMDNFNAILKFPYSDVRKYDKYFIYLIKDDKNRITKSKEAVYNFLKVYK